MVVSYFVHSYRPRLRLDRQQFKELFGFGKWILGSSILGFLLNQGDDIFLGKVLGVTALGLYQMAYRISNLPATEITHVISRVTFPAYSKLQDRLPQLRQAYLQTLQVVAFFSFPIAGGIAFLAPDFTRLFLGEKWMPMVPAMQILVVWGLIRSISATTGPLFQAVGQPRLSTKLQFIKLLLLGALIYPLTARWGILGTSLAVVLNALLVDPLAGYLAIKIIHCHVWTFSKLIILPLTNTMTMLGMLLVLKHLLLSANNMLYFFLAIGIGAIIYAFIAQLFERLFRYGIKSTLRERLLLKERWKKTL